MALKIYKLKDFENINVSISNEEEHKNVMNTVFLIESLYELLIKRFDVNESRKLNIIFEPKNQNPVCLKEKGIIILTSPIEQWDRVVYQLAHELCHLNIYGDGTKEMQWFEESICEMASYYFLIKMYKKWNRLSRVERNPMFAYAKNFYTYYTIVSKEYLMFSTKTMIENPRDEILQKMKKDSKIRELNRYIAIRLLPVFQKQAKMWKAVQYLGECSTTDNFQNFLNEWNSIAKEKSQVSIDTIIDELKNR